MSAGETAEKTSFNYSRFAHPYQVPLENFTKQGFQFLAECEQRHIQLFKESQQQTDVNIFMDIDFDRFLDDLGFHIIGYEDFSSFKDPAQTKQLLYEMKSITENLLQNIEANFSACENLQKINAMKSKISEQNQDCRNAFTQLEGTPDFTQKTGDLRTLFAASEQIATKYSKLIIKIKQFEFFFSQDMDALHASLSKVDAGDATFENIRDVSKKCVDALQSVALQLAGFIDMQFVKEDSKLVG